MKEVEENLWKRLIQINVKGKHLDFVLDEMRKKSELNLIYNNNETEKINVSFNLELEVEEALLIILEQSGFTFKKYLNNTAVIFKNNTIKKRILIDVKKPLGDNRVKVIDKSELKPILISNINPIYPEAAFDNKLEGEVLLKILVGENGNVNNVVLDSTSGHKILDTASINTAYKLKFKPAEYQSVAHKTWTAIVFRYKFKDTIQ